jgi:hypothetical protein
MEMVFYTRQEPKSSRPEDGFEEPTLLIEIGKDAAVTVHKETTVEEGRANGDKIVILGTLDHDPKSYSDAWSHFLEAAVALEANGGFDSGFTGLLEQVFEAGQRCPIAPAVKA